MISTKRALIGGGAAVAIALAAGFGVAKLTTDDHPPAAAGAAAGTDPHGHGPEQQAAEAQRRPATPGAAASASGAAEAEGGEEGFVAMTDERASAAGIVVATPMRGGGQEIRLSGRAEAAPSARAMVAAPIGGSIERVYVAIGSPVGAGSPLAVIRSGEGAAIRADTAVVRAQADGARAAEQAAAAAFAREGRLLREGVVSRQSWEASRASLLQAQAQTRTALAQARAADARAAAAGGPAASGQTAIRSPISGVVTNVSAAAGGFVAQGGQVATISNPRLTEMVFNAPAALAERLQSGQRLNARGASGQEYPAVIVGLAPDAVETSGATLVRARALGATPPAGAPLSASVVVDSTGGFTVPAQAVQTVDGRSVVFVREARGFRMRPVTPGRTADDRTEILSGLNGNEQVVGAGAFLLKAELGRSEAEHAH